MIANLRYLLTTFDRRSRVMLVLNACAQFIVAVMDLLGLAAIFPLMQVAMGKSITQGNMGHLHSLLGNQSRNGFAVTLSVIMAFAFLAKAILSSWLNWWSLGLMTHLQTTTSTRLLSAYINEDYLAHRRRNTGEIIRTVGSSTQAACQNVLGGLMTVGGSLLSVVFSASLLFFISPATTLYATIYFTIAVFVLQRLLAPANRRAGEVAQHTSWIASKTLFDAMHGFREANLHQAQDFFVSEYDRANVLNAGASQKANFLGVLPKSILEFVTMLGLTLLIMTSILTGNAKEMMPVLSLFVAAVVKILPLMVSMTATLGLIRFGRQGLEITVDALKEMEPSEHITRQAHSLNSGAPSKLPENASLIVDDVSFRYDLKNSNVLNHINLRVDAGKSLALCGPSGSGKTTLVDIMLGLISPTEGSVTYGGIPTDARDSRWFEAVAYVPQDVYIMDDSLANNIAFGQPQHKQDREKILRCIERAQLSDVVAMLPDGIETSLGERGTRMSGGQRQRIGIARALYRDPKVIVFDEATSALDNETEHRITQTVNSLRGDITTIIVAHRLSTVRNVDTLAFLSDGHVEALGTFDEVEAASPAFARLVELGQLAGNQTSPAQI